MMLRHKLLDFLSPAIRFLGKIHAPYTHKSINEKTARKLYSIIESGDIILARRNGELSNVMISGHYKHAAIYAPSFKANYDCDSFVEAVYPKVRSIGFFDILLKYDDAIVIRNKINTAKQNYSASLHARAHIGLPYDFLFDIPDESERKKKPNRAFYCAELAYWVHHLSNPELPFTLRKIWGVMTVIPDDFINAKDCFEIVWDSNNP